MQLKGCTKKVSLHIAIKGYWLFRCNIFQYYTIDAKLYKHRASFGQLGLCVNLLCLNFRISRASMLFAWRDSKNESNCYCCDNDFFHGAFHKTCFLLFRVTCYVTMLAFFCLGKNNGHRFTTRYLRILNANLWQLFRSFKSPCKSIHYCVVFLVKIRTLCYACSLKWVKRVILC